jgi:hypothetical protein
LVALPILDVALVSVSRTRRGVTLMTGGWDHLTHRIMLAVHTPRRVALTLATTQLVLCGCAIGGYELGGSGVSAFAFAAFSAGLFAILVLDRPRWRPPGIATRLQEEVVPPGSQPSVNVDSG